MLRFFLCYKQFHSISHYSFGNDLLWQSCTFIRVLQNYFTYVLIRFRHWKYIKHSKIKKHNVLLQKWILWWKETSKKANVMPCNKKKIKEVFVAILTAFCLSCYLASQGHCSWDLRLPKKLFSLSNWTQVKRDYKCGWKKSQTLLSSAIICQWSWF